MKTTARPTWRAVSRAAACVRGATEQTTLNNRVMLLHVGAAILESTRQFGTLVGGDAARDAEYDAHV